MSGKLRIAHMAGPTATIQNSPPLVTSNKARAKYGIEPRKAANGADLRFDPLRSQRLAAPAKVYVEQFSAHPLESDAAHLYAPPDGYVGKDGVFRKERGASDDKPVFEVELHPEDGLYPLPYMARQADGKPWDDVAAEPDAPEGRARQGFYPDGSRSFEEIDRFGIEENGLGNAISTLAEVDFYRVMPPGGFTRGRAKAARGDAGEGDIAPETRGRDFFPYAPRNLAFAPPRPALAVLTNRAHAVLTSRKYDGAVWTQGSPQVEETSYWFNLLMDTTIPICCNAAQRPHGQLGADGPHNIADSVRYIASKVWADEQGRNRAGVVVVQEQQFFAAREVAKVDARPGGYVATGGHGGIVGQISHAGRCVLTYLPVFKHTYKSDLTFSKLPERVEAVRRVDGRLERFTHAIKGADGMLVENAIPSVSIVKDGGYAGLEWGDKPEVEEDLIALVDHKLRMNRLGGFVLEGLVPYGNAPSGARMPVLLRAVFSGLPLVRVGRGASEGFADPLPALIGGSNLTATKARMLLMACLMKFGALPTAADQAQPTPAEMRATLAAVEQYQQIFDTH